VRFTRHFSALHLAVLSPLPLLEKTLVNQTRCWPVPLVLPGAAPEPPAVFPLSLAVGFGGGRAQLTVARRKVKVATKMALLLTLFIRFLLIIYFLSHNC
jgi:hypothetical protein